MNVYTFDSIEPFDLENCYYYVPEESQLLKFCSLFLVDNNKVSSRKKVTSEIINQCLNRYKGPELVEFFIEICTLTNRLTFLSTDYQEKKPCRCIWDQDAIEEYKFLLEKFKKYIIQLKNPHNYIKGALWECISFMLFEKGYIYSPTQCSIKYKNLKSTSSSEVNTSFDSSDVIGRKNTEDYENSNEDYEY